MNLSPLKNEYNHEDLIPFDIWYNNFSKIYPNIDEKIVESYIYRHFDIAKDNLNYLKKENIISEVFHKNELYQIYSNSENIKGDEAFFHKEGNRYYKIRTNHTHDFLENYILNHKEIPFPIILIKSKDISIQIQSIRWASQTWIA